MSKKKIVAIAAVLAGVGAIAAVSAPGPRGWMGRHGGQMGGQMQDGHEGAMGRRGWFGGDLTKDAFESRTRERFAALDKNSDGFIDAAEIEAAFANRGNGMMGRFGRGRSGGDAAGAGGGERMLARFDTNHDGKVTKDEFLAHVRKRFAEADLNNDGKITDDDLPPMMRGHGAIDNLAKGQGGLGGRRMGGAGGAGMGFLGTVEVKDGAITLDAALAAATRMFDGFDRNKDGTFDKADVDVVRKEMTDYRVKRFIHANSADKDGKVSREQFFAKANERFAALDVNGDGKIGRGEMGGGRRGMRGGMHGGHPGMGDGHGPAGGPMGEGRPGMPKQ